jgi:hypothetical protein
MYFMPNDLISRIGTQMHYAAVSYIEHPNELDLNLVYSMLDTIDTLRSHLRPIALNVHNVLLEFKENDNISDPIYVKSIASMLCIWY